MLSRLYSSEFYFRIVEYDKIQNIPYKMGIVSNWFHDYYNSFLFILYKIVQTCRLGQRAIIISVSLGRPDAQARSSWPALIGHFRL